MDHGQDIEAGKGSLRLQIDISTIFYPRIVIDTPKSPPQIILICETPKSRPQFIIATPKSPNFLSVPKLYAPEKKLTLFALRLAVLEKAATGLGALGFIWATVVLLGGFAVKLAKDDFWFITIILLIEGARIFSRSHELEWQRHETTSVKAACLQLIRMVSKQNQQSRRGRSIHPENSHRKWDQKKMPTRTWNIADVPIIPFSEGVFQSKYVSKVLFWLQLASATACAVLSLMKLIKQNFGEVNEDKDTRNRKVALIIFYSLALAEALLFLLEKAYWEWQIHCKVLEEVNKECKLEEENEECELEPLGMVSIRRFFYDAYSRCISGSIFDGLKMDMVSFAMDLLASNSHDEQLIGINVLRKFTENEMFSYSTLQKIGMTLPVMERLVEMLNWKHKQEKKIRRSAAQILSKLVGKKQNILRVSEIPGAMESISSLLQTHRTSRGLVDESPEKIVINIDNNYDFSEFNELGLLILMKLARDHDNCGKIGNTRGLLPKIIDFTHVEEGSLKEEGATTAQNMTMKRALQVLKRLTSTTGTTGKQLRNAISEGVFTISNIRDILKYGEKQAELQQLGIEILTSLAMEADTREKIGGTGGVLKELVNIFFKEGMPENQDDVRIAAGEALAMLAFESKSNGRRILKLKVIEQLVKALEVQFLRKNAARILKNLCIYMGEDCSLQLRGVINAAPIVLRAIMSEENKLQEDCSLQLSGVINAAPIVLTAIMSEKSKLKEDCSLQLSGVINAAPIVLTAIMSEKSKLQEENKLQEVMVGLAANVFKFMTSEESSKMFKKAGTQESDLARALVQILKKYQNPAINTPRIRRFVIELAIWMMRQKEATVQNFKGLEMSKEMESVIETTSELENFNFFSGAIGMSPHSTSIHSLVETAMKLLE